METVLKMGVEGNVNDKYFSTYPLDKSIKKYGIHGYGKSVKEAIEDTYDSLEEMKEIAKANGDSFPNVRLEFVFDIGALFNYYSFLNIPALASKLGINASLLNKYASGACKPSHEKVRQIQQGIHSLAKEMQSIVVL